MEDEVKQVEVAEGENKVIENETEKEPKEQEEVESLPTKAEQFEFADLYIKCGQCGEETKLIKEVEGGLSIVLPTRSDTVMTLACPKCGNKITLFYKGVTAKKPSNIILSDFIDNKKEDAEVGDVTDDVTTDLSTEEAYKESYEKGELVYEDSNVV
jgi:ribosomal protein S27E